MVASAPNESPPLTGKTDPQPDGCKAPLPKGEYIINAAAVARYGKAAMEWLKRKHKDERDDDS